jgi:hypothetical protein
VSLDAQHLTLLELHLDAEIVPHLPPLLKPSKSAEENSRKNRSRAFSAFALASLCSISKSEAANAVVDDFDDYGVDAIYYHAPSETLYIVQSKLKAAETFGQEEALAFCQGVRKLLKQDLLEFNENVKKRLVEIEGALESCSKIKLVIAHTGAGISKHAKHAVDELLADEDHGEERLDGSPVDYGAERVVEDLRGAKAYKKVNADLLIQKCEMVSEPRITYFGMIPLTDLVALHQKHDKALYERNIRTFLGHKTEVNASIQQTLSAKPQDFLFLNNGVTILCEDIEPKNIKAGRKRLKIRGLSVINGAQTIASSARFAKDNPAKDISAARVSVTLIKADADSTFGKQVTQARNHQNPVHFSNFAALDDEQERLRRDLAHLGIDYVYKAEAVDQAGDPNRVRIDEAAQALAIFAVDPRYVVWLKKEPAQLLDTNSERYKSLFGPNLSALQLANAVRVNRFMQQRMAREALAASGRERLAYKHGAHAVAWMMAKRLRDAIAAPVLIDSGKLATVLSSPFDQLRQSHWDHTKAAAMVKGPLAIFRNQGDAIPLLRKVAVQHFGLAADPVLEHKLKQQTFGQPYPLDLFAYIAQKAPQIGGIS